MHHAASLTKTTQVASEWTHSSQPTNLQSQTAVLPEKPSAEALEEAPLVEDEGFPLCTLVIFSNTYF